MKQYFGYLMQNHGKHNFGLVRSSSLQIWSVFAWHLGTDIYHVIMSDEIYCSVAVHDIERVLTTELMYSITFISWNVWKPIC